MRHHITRDAANCQQAAGSRWLFVGVELRAYHGCHSVGADENLAFSGAPIGKLHMNAIVVSDKPDGWRCEIDGGKADGVDERTVQHRAQDADRVLVEQDTHRGDVQTAQDASVGSAHLAARRDEAALPHRVAKAQLPQGVHGVGSEEKGEPEFARGRRTLEDPNVPASSSQRNSGSEAADPCSDNQCLRHDRYNVFAPVSTAGTVMIPRSR
jgi:hypothetical protein